jgi:hypothetical protein
VQLKELFGTQIDVVTNVPNLQKEHLSSTPVLDTTDFFSSFCCHCKFVITIFFIILTFSATELQEF